MKLASKLVLATAAVSFAVACETVLGEFEVLPPGTLVTDSGTDSGQQVQQNTADGGPDATGTTVRSCDNASDCPAVEMTPAACATAECLEHKCVYSAVDVDGDGRRLAGCVVEGVPLQGDDCADDAPSVFPGASCAKKPDGSDINFPNALPVGACKAGTWACVAGKAVCQGAIAPQPTENCTLKNDANCDGVPDDGCDCEPNTTGECGNTRNLPLPCKKGTRTCSAEGKWGDCQLNVEPKARDCSSTVDNDCSGAADQGEAACQCPGGVAQGGTQACKVIGGLGECAEGKRTCQPSVDKQTGVFGVCAGPKPQKPACKPGYDFDCNGTSDELEVACGSPCLESGSPVAASQKFAENIWGCGSTRPFPARGEGCSRGWSVCSVKYWGDYIRGVSPKVPTHKYWLQEQLGWGGAPGSCFVPIKETTACGVNSSMTVCPYAGGAGTITDPEGNQCNWSGCTIGDVFKYNDYMGGCAGNDSGGTLCCQ